MNFSKLGITPQQNNSAERTEGKKLFSLFGIKKGEKITPLKKDTVQITINQTEAERDLALAIAPLAEKSFGNKEMFAKILTKVVTNGTERNPELLQKRIEFLKTKAPSMLKSIEDIVILELRKNGNTSFLLNNIEEIDAILKEKDFKPSQKKELLQLLNKENYQDFIEFARNTQLSGDDFASVAKYNASKHTIAYGNETAIVDSSEVISLISGLQSLSTLQTNSYDKFNATVDSLVADEYKNGKLQYHQIVYGLLQQMPKLAMIAHDYSQFSESISEQYRDNPKKYFAEIEKYFNELDESGLLPKMINLKTIVPDENALINPDETLRAFLYNQRTTN